MIRLLLLVLAALAAAACGSVEIDRVATGSGGSGGGGTGGTGGGGGEGCPDDPAFFTEHLWEPLFAPKCLTCHVEGGLAASTRLVFVPYGSPDWLEKNQATFRSVAQIDTETGPLLLLKPTGQHPDGHGGGTVVVPGSRLDEDLRHLVAWVRGEVESCTPPEVVACEDVSGPRLLRRLTHAEYRRTVADLLGLEAERAATFAPDPMIRGFSNDAAALQVDPLLADQYRASAEAIAAAAVTSRLDEILPCHRTEQASCAADFVHDFGQRAFRRPLTTEEQRRYADLFLETAQEDGFAEGLRWVIAAFLQSPHFLYRSELGARADDGSFALGPFEIASQLSYLFTGTMPDQALFDAAASGALATPAGVRAQVERLAADPRSQEAMASFFASWLQLERLADVPRDAATYPELTPAIRAAMQGEIARLVADLAASDATLADALDLQHTWVTDELAAYYGIDPGTAPADEAGFRRVETTGTPYGGLLTVGGLLMTHALPNSSSPIHRGKLIRERFLCHELPPPPASMNVSPPPMDPALSTRERYAQHASDGACSSCHDLVDPIGFAFEHFDGDGRWREKDGAHAIDDSGEIVHSVSTDGTFDGVAGLAAKLGASEEVEGCYTTLWTTYALGLGESDGLACALGQKLPGAGIATLRAGTTELAHFRSRSGGEDEGDAPGPAADPGPVTIDWAPAPVVFVLTETGRWTGSACFDASVTNNGGEPLTWRIEERLEGTLNNIWNAEAAPGTDGRTIFTGASWNATLAPGAMAEFGFCVDL